MAGWKINYFFSWLTTLLVNRGRNPRGFRYERILVIRLDEIGDMVTSLPVFDRLRQVFPEAELTAWATPLTGTLLENHPGVSRVVYEAPDAAQRYDLVVDLRGSFATMWYTIKHRPRIRLDRGTVRFRNKFLKKQHPHEVDTNLQVVEPVTGIETQAALLRLEVSDENKRVAELFLSENKIDRFVLFHAGARKVLRRWPGNRFAELGSALHERYGLVAVFAGVPDELEDIEAIRSQMSVQSFVFCGFSLTDLAALASRADLFVGNESGPMHLASAMGIPVIGLFGPGEPHVFAPYGDQCGYVHHKLECNPCGQVICKHPENTCMDRITVEEVMTRAEAMLR